MKSNEDRTALIKILVIVAIFIAVVILAYFVFITVMVSAILHVVSYLPQSIGVKYYG